MLLSTTSERGASGSPAPAGPPRARRAGGWPSGSCAAAGVIAAAVVTIGTTSILIVQVVRFGGCRRSGRHRRGERAGVDERHRRARARGRPPIRRTCRPGRSCPAATCRRPSPPATRPSTTSPGARSTVPARWPPATTATTVTEGVLALSLHDFARALASSAGRAHEQVADDPDPLAILIDASVELGRYDEAEAHLAELLAAPTRQRRTLPPVVPPRAARRPRGRPPGHAAGRAGRQRPPTDRATIATFIGDQLLAARDLTGAAAAYERARAAGSPGWPRPRSAGPVLAAAQGRLDEAIATLDRRRRALPRPGRGRRPRRAPAGSRPRRRGRRQLRPRPRPAPSSSPAPGSTVDLESAVFAADHGDPDRGGGAGRARPTRTRRDRVHRRRARLGADDGRSRRRRRCRTSTRRCRLGTRSPALHVHAAIAFAADRRSPTGRRPRSNGLRIVGLAGPRAAGRRRPRWPTGWAYLSPQDWRP